MKKITENRRNEITKLILANEHMRVEQLAKLFQVTPETIRTDFRYLETKGVLYRTHGGASCRNTNALAPMDIRSKEQLDVKQSIAYRAIDYIKDDMVIFLDAASTILPLGNLLRLRRNLTIYTNSLELLPILSVSEHRILFVGGEYDRFNKFTTGFYAEQMIEHVYFDLLVCGMDGCKDMSGPGLEVMDELSLKKALLKHAKLKLLLSGAEKWDRPSKFQYADFSDFDIVITENLRKEIKDQLSIKIVDVHQ
ncbi:MAG: DeoR/GlpR family DNA-binding transcription regulator [Longicatena sp.]